MDIQITNKTILTVAKACPARKQSSPAPEANFSNPFDSGNLKPQTKFEDQISEQKKESNTTNNKT